MRPIIVILMVGWAMAGQAAGIVLSPVADTSLFEQNPDNNLGGATNCVAGSNTSGLRSRALLRFDLTGQLPTNAVIQSAALTVNIIIVPGGGGVGSTFDLRRMLVGWTEGTGTTSMGQAAKTGESTWNHRAHPSVSWSTPGGAISNEYSPTVSSSVPIDAIGAYTFVTTTNMVADVQQLLLNPSTNFGWAMFSESEGVGQTSRRFASREAGVIGPLLTITYTVASGPPAAPTLQNIARTGNQFQFSFPAVAGQSYTVQYISDLVSGGWSNLISIPPPGVATDIIVTDGPATNLQRFYRVIAPY